MMSAVQTLFGHTVQGDAVTRTVLTNSKGTEVALLNYGAIIQAIRTKDVHGQLTNIVLSCDTLEDYQRQKVYLGAVAGRCANRIANGHLSLEQNTYQLTRNNGGNHLHGGEHGLHQKIWQQHIVESCAAISVVMTCYSNDGEDGYPGTVKVQVTYTLSEDDTLDIRYQATTDKTTVVNLTQHSYFNLKGHGDCLDHQLQMDAESWLPLNENAIPRGDLQSVEGSVFDFLAPKSIGFDLRDGAIHKSGQDQLRMSRGYDHNYCLHTSTVSAHLHRFAEVWEPTSGRFIQFYTDQPGVQFYTGNYLEGCPAPNGQTYINHAGFCLESQAWPDAPNHPDFPSITLKPTETYHHHTRWVFGCHSNGLS